jgi:hypothetical protein
MKRMIGLGGFLIGLLLGVALLLTNPLQLTQGRPAPLSGAVNSLGWESSGYRGMALTPGSLLGLGAPPPRRGFADPAIAHARVEVVVLGGEPGNAPALGVRLSAVATQNSLLRASLGVQTAWNLLWPERGSLQLAGSENLWAPLRDGSWSAVRGRGFVPGASRYPLPPLPGAGAPLLVAGTGEFAAARGVFREEFAPAADAPAEFTGLRQLHYSIE